MNREQLLLGGVVAIFALWFFVLREPPTPREDTQPGSYDITLRTVPDATRPTTLLGGPDHPVFTLNTNEKDHPRPALALPTPRTLANIWPPTSRTLRTSLLGRLRRPSVAPSGAAATIALPALGTSEKKEDGTPAVDRMDSWESYGQSASGRVLEMRVNGKVVREPRELPSVGTSDGFYRLLCLLEIDPGKAAAEGVTHVRVRLASAGGGGASFQQKFDSEIREFKVATSGKQQGWLLGLKRYLRLPEGAVEPRVAAGRAMLEYGVDERDNVAIDWALFILEEARKLTPADAPDIRRRVLELMLEGANKRNLQERVLQLAFGYLDRYPRDATVLEYVGGMLESRSFDLPTQAEAWYAKAAQSTSAQRRRVGVLIRLGRFEEARALIDGGKAGRGEEVDLLRARVALALGDLETAKSRARGVTGQDRAEALQILGGAAYAEGNAAEAERQFRAAVEADPRRSTAYSDLGLAYAVQGKDADARLCLARAAELDFENTVVPALGDAFLKLNANDLAGARQILDKLRNDNPGDLLVRYFVGYAQELGGELEAAAKTYRSVLDDNHRYRIAIARLGLTQARRVEEGASDADLIKAADAHLQKAVDLNPDDPILPYILGRFLMSVESKPKTADELFRRTAQLEPPAGDETLPFWAEAARGALLYRLPSSEVIKVKGDFNSLQDKIKRAVQRAGSNNPLQDVKAHPVWAYAQTCLDEVQENEKKVDVVWTFLQQPRDWQFNAREEMKVVVPPGGGIEFRGRVDFKGERRDHTNVLEFCAVEYQEKRLSGNHFYEAIFEGEIPEGTRVDVGLGLLGKARGGRSSSRGRTGVQIRRQASSGRPDLRLDGGKIDVIKRTKAQDYIELDKVSWPAGPFRIRFLVEDRKEGTVLIELNGNNVFQAQWGQASDACRLFTRGSGSQPLSLFVWVEGNDGEEYARIKLNKVTLTKSR